MPEVETKETTQSGKTVVHGATLMVAMRGISRLIGIVSTAFLARLLRPDDFGLVVLGTSALNIIQMLSDLSLGSALVRMRDVTPAHYHTAWTLGLARGCGIAALITVGAPYVASVMNEPRLTPILWTLAAAAVIQSFENIRLADCQREMDFAPIFRYQFLGRVLSFFVTLCLAYMLRNYWALVAATLVTSVVNTCYSYVLKPHRPRLSLRARREFFDFSKWAVLGTYLAVIDNYSITFLIGWLGGTRGMGLFQVSQQIAALPASEVAAPIRPPLYAEFARLLQSPPELRWTFINGFALLFLVITPMSLGICLTAPMLTPLALGAQWSDAIPMMQVGVFYALFDAFGHYPQNLFVVMNRQPRLLMLAVIFLAVRVPAAILGGHLGGATGAVYGMATSAFFGAVFWLGTSLPLVGGRAIDILRTTWRSAVAGLFMAAALQALARSWPLEVRLAMVALQLIIFIVVGAIVHVGSLFLLWRYCGSPPGAEAKALNIAQNAFRKSLQPIPGLQRGMR